MTSKKYQTADQPQNLNFASKIIENSFALQLKRFLDKFAVFDEHHSAYRKYHSTLTVLLDITSNPLLGLNNKSTFLMVSLYLSAAFDTVDHERRLSFLFQIGIIGQVHSLINGQTKYVINDGSYSEDKSFKTSVLQGSILGPLFFILYLISLRTRLTEILASYHIYTYDITISLEFDQGTTLANFLNHRKIIASVLKLLTASKLRINSSNTQCMFITNQRNHLPERITIDGIKIEMKGEVKVLGDNLDIMWPFSSFINNNCSKSYYHLRMITSIRNFLSFDLTMLLILTFVASRPNYCNSLFKSMPPSLSTKF